MAIFIQEDSSVTYVMIHKYLVIISHAHALHEVTTYKISASKNNLYELNARHTSI